MEIFEILKTHSQKNTKNTKKKRFFLLNGLFFGCKIKT